MQDMQDANPVNPLPPVVLGLFLVLMGVELVLTLAAEGIVGGPQGVGWRIAAIDGYAFSPAVWERVTERGDLSFDMLKRFVGYVFVHSSFTHALFAAALLLALGKFVGDLFHAGAVLAVLGAATLSGAVAYALLAPGNVALFGAYPPVYGLIGAFTYLMWLRLGQLGQNQYRAFQLIAVLLGIQLFFALVFGGNPTWIADVAGFAGGLAVSPLVAPGGWQAFMRRMRQR